MKHTKLVSMLMAIVMLMGVLTVPASAVVAGGAIGSPSDDDPIASVEKLFRTSVEYVRECGANVRADYDTMTIEYLDKSGQPLGYKAIMSPDTKRFTYYDPEGEVLPVNQNIDWSADNPFANIKSAEPAQQEIAINTQALTEATETEPKTEIKSEAKHFADVPDDAWYAEAVNALAANGILNGYDDGLFHPENTITIGELSVIVYRLATGEDPVGKTGCYPDVYRDEYGQSNHWAAYAHEALYSRKLHYVNKWTDHIDEPATRGDAINTVYLLTVGVKGLKNMTIVPEWDFTWDDWNIDATGRFKYTNAELQEKSGIPDIQLDPNLMYGNAMDIIQGIMLAYKYGIVNGIDENGSCNNLANITRAELCQMLYNAGITGFTTHANWKVGSSCRGIITNQ